MQVNPDIFKANDIRGTYPDALDDAVAYAIGRAFVTLLKVNKVVVGRDIRLSSPPMFHALTQGLMDAGADVLNIGMVSTDQYYYACATLNQAGIMVTASHNPPEYGGFKMVKQMPEILGGDMVQDLRNIVETEDFARLNRHGKMIERAREIALPEGFTEKVLSLIDVDALTPLKVIMEEIAHIFGKAGEVEWMDGVSISFDNFSVPSSSGHRWHFNVRPSNTEPLLRLNVEATSRELMEQQRDAVLKVIRRES